MRVLVACEESQAVTIEFRKLGHEAFSCDIEECSGGHHEWHIKGDVREVLNDEWDMIIAFPPCTYMSKAGARWMFPKGELNADRYEKAMKAKELFMLFFNHPCQMVAIENPVPMKIIGLPEPTQAIQPYEFGHPYSKKTLLWLRGLPPLSPTKFVAEHKPFLPSNVGYGKRKGNKWSRGIAHNAKDASKTFPGIAKAMAEQWGGKNK